MTQADAFLHDILAHPDDDAPRLIYADWLEEQGEPGSVARADFIRIQCALAGGHVSPHKRVELERREQQLLDAWGSDWARSIRRLVQDWEFHRGFIDEVAVFADRFLLHAQRLFRRAPIQRLDLWPPLGAAFPTVETINMAALVDNEHLRRLRSLDLSENRLQSRDLRALVVSENLTNLTALNLSHNRIGDGGIRALAASPLLGQLEHLNLRFNDIGAGSLRALAHAVEALARTPDGLRLQRLELSYDHLGVAAQRVIADSALLRRLVRG